MTVRTAIHRPVPPGALPEFTPVPRKIQRHDGWTPMRQREPVADVEPAEYDIVGANNKNYRRLAMGL